MDSLIWLRSQWDRVAGWALILAAVFVVGAATAQARGVLYAPDQFSFLMSGGVGGLTLGALGSALLVSAGFHDEWRRLDRIEVALQDRARVARLVSSDGAASEPPAPAKAGLGLWIRAEWDRVLGWTLVVASFVWLLVAYRPLAHSLFPAKQVAYLVSGGIGALFVLFLGGAALLLADWKDGRHKLARVAELQGHSRWTDAHRDTSGDPHTSRRPSPGQLAVGVVLGLAVGVIAFGWWKAADAVRLERAMDGLVIAAAGLGLGLAALAAMAIVIRLRFGREMARVVSGIVSNDEHEVFAPRSREVDLSDLWTADGLRRFHRASCPALLPAGGGRRPVTPRDSNLEPCLLCDDGE
jgi:hypothetical protein